MTTDTNMATAIMEATALQFKIGDRTYWLGRSRDSLHWRIVANGDTVESASILHYGDVQCFLKMANRLKEIEDQWAENTM